MKAFGMVPDVPNHGLAVRVSLLFWLVRNGKFSWAWQTGAWFHIITNSKQLPDNNATMWNRFGYFEDKVDSWPVTASQFVSDAIEYDCRDDTHLEPSIRWPIKANEYQATMDSREYKKCLDSRRV